MFCYQCEQAKSGVGCATIGVCGKEPLTSDLQDKLVYELMNLSSIYETAKKNGTRKDEIDRFIIDGLFTTVTNVNFDSSDIKVWIERSENYKNELSSSSKTYAQVEVPLSISERKKMLGDDLAGLYDLVIYGLKGMAAYIHHAAALGIENPEIYDFVTSTLSYITKKRPAEDILGRSLKIGEANLKVMEMLDRGHTDSYGHPTPTKVRITPVKGKAILVSGHDLKDLYELLKQTSGTGINVYTHNEMLPAHGYPKLKEFKHLVGNYGGAWQDQHKEFDEFPGAILMTTNCIQKPRDSYKDRILTCGLVQWPGVTHLEHRDFKKVIEKALQQDGFTQDTEPKYVTVGFGHNAVMSVAPQVIDAVKSGAIRHFFLIGGCDGAKSGRNYYTEFATALPKDTVILTLACGKFRFNKQEFGDIGGIPRLLDVGQCNDAYSAIQIALALSQAFKTDVNSLPLSLILSWYEQKAVVILLTLLHLGIKNIRLGPTLPAFLTPSTLQILVDNFGIKPIGEAKEDIKAILG